MGCTGGLDQRRWQKRWFVLADDFLFYYSTPNVRPFLQRPLHASMKLTSGFFMSINMHWSECFVQSAAPKGIMRLDRLRACAARSCEEAEQEFAFSVPAAKKTYVLAASYNIERDEWIEALNRAGHFLSGPPAGVGRE